MVSPLFVTNTPPMDCFSEVKSITCFPVTFYPVSIPSQILAQINYSIRGCKREVYLFKINSIGEYPIISKTFCSQQASGAAWSMTEVAFLSFNLALRTKHKETYPKPFNIMSCFHHSQIECGQHCVFFETILHFKKKILVKERGKLYLWFWRLLWWHS